MANQQAEIATDLLLFVAAATDPHGSLRPQFISLFPSE